MFRDDIPVTAPVQTLVDLATELDLLPLERAVNDADKRDLIDPEALREELVRFGGVPGVLQLRRLLDKLFFQLSDSDLEIYFRRIVRAAKLPIPLSKQRVNNFEVDFFWPELVLVVETDDLHAEFGWYGVVGGRRCATEGGCGQAVLGRREAE